MDELKESPTVVVQVHASLVMSMTVCFLVPMIVFLTVAKVVVIVEVYV